MFDPGKIKRLIYDAFQVWVTTIHVAIFTVALFAVIDLTLLLLFTRFYWITLLYLAWFFYDEIIKKTSIYGTHLWRPIRKLTIWTILADYFPVRLHKTVELDPSYNYIFAAHPVSV